VSAEKQLPANIGHWTIDTYAIHNEALRAAEEKFQQERDRRYAEVKSAEEKALRVKEQADRDALGLAREIQTYKDEKANELREQISRERGNYASQADLRAAVEKIEATMGPVLTFVSSQQGSGKGIRDLMGWIVAAAMLVIALWPHIK
jgi:vacuolar-type H+-ATPase subunit H